MLLNFIFSKINNEKRKKEWRFQNQHNMTTLRLNGSNQGDITVGRGTYGELDVYNDTDSKLVIGSYCSIAAGVKFLVGLDHNIENISTYPFKISIMNEKTEAISKGDIVVEDDVWIGNDVTILSGVHIGQGAVIAARAVVCKDVPPYAVVGGVPAKVIKYRFSEEVVEELIKVDYSKLDSDIIKKHLENLYESIDNIEQLSWLPKKKQ